MSKMSNGKGKSRVQMLDMSRFPDLQPGDNVAVYDERSRMCMFFIIYEDNKGNVRARKRVVRRRKENDVIYIRDDDRLFVKTKGGSMMCDVYDYEGIVRDADIQDEDEGYDEEYDDNYGESEEE